MKPQIMDNVASATIPDELAHLVDTGHQALTTGDIDTARTAFEQAAERYADEPVVHNNLGALYMGLGDYAAAEQAFTRVVDLLPNRANPLFNQAMARFRQEEFDGAVEAFAAAAALDPEDPETRNNLGAARFQAGDIETARQDMVAALQQQPNFPNAVLNLCDLEVADGAPEIAIQLCEAYLEHHRDLGVLRRLLELLDSQARVRVEQAIPHAEAMVAACTGDNAARRHLGRLLEARQALRAEA